LSASKASITPADLLSYPSAIENAIRFTQIPFAEFTAKLINDTFDALIAANIRQADVYASLLNKIAEGLTKYVNDTKDEVDVNAVMDFLKGTLSADLVNKITMTAPQENGVGTTHFDEEECEILNAALTPTNDKLADANKVEIKTTESAKSQIDAITKACAVRISENKYNLLKNMVEMGVLRLVIDSGLIETKIIFNTFDHYEVDAKARDSINVLQRQNTSSYLFGLIKSSQSTYMTICPATASANGDTNTNVTITGTVQIKFKSDYKPLLSQV
jgi:hypothetical protein